MTGVVLAGGKSSRMGQEKGLVEVGGQRMIFTVTSILRHAPEVDSVIVVTNNPERFSFLDLPMIPDYFPGKGPLAGIHAALNVVRDWIFVAACDMPLLSPELPRYLWDRRDGRDLVVPRIHGHWATVAALYGPGCLGALNRMLRLGAWGLKDVLEGLQLRQVSAQDLSRTGIYTESFLSVNTLQDLAQVRTMTLDGTRG